MMRHNRYSSWLTITDEIAVDTTNLDLSQRIVDLAAAQYGWNGGSNKKLRAIITITPGTTISSADPALPALTVPVNVFRSYDLIILNNRGTIAGAGGAAGLGGINGNDGGNGGIAFSASRSVLLVNDGNIFGGGGGGGGGGGHQLGTVRNSFPPPLWFLNCNGPAGDGCCGDPNNWCTFSNNGGAVCTADSFCGCRSEVPGAITQVINCGVDCNCNWGGCGGSGTDCSNQLGGNGGSGRGYGVPNAALNGDLSPGDCLGFGGNAGDWGQPGSDGGDGCSTVVGSRNAGLGGAGGLPGSAISGNAFISLRGLGTIIGGIV